MSFASAINLVTIALCSAVLVQCWRMMRALESFRAADFPGTIQALERATAGAQDVLTSIRRTLAEDAEPKLRALADAGHAVDELGVMIGIANASADRLLDVARETRLGRPDLAA